MDLQVPQNPLYKGQRGAADSQAVCQAGGGGNGRDRLDHNVKHSKTEKILNTVQTEHTHKLMQPVI